MQDGGRLAHLSGEGAAIRQVLAAHFLRDCAHIVEIGGAGLPITGFLTHRPLSVTVIDPKIAPYAADSLMHAPCAVRHIAAKFQQALPTLEAGSYGLALLGLSLKPFGSAAAVTRALRDFAMGARRVVVEHAVALDRAAANLPALIGDGFITEVRLDFSIEDGVIEASGFGARRLLVLRPTP